MIIAPACDVRVQWALRTHEGVALQLWSVPSGEILMTSMDETLEGGLVLWAGTAGRPEVPVWVRWTTKGSWVPVVQSPGDRLIARATLER